MARRRATSRQEAAFIREAVRNGGVLHDAAAKAGYTQPNVAVHRLTRRADVVRQVQDGLIAELAAGAPVALDTLRDLMQPHQPASARVAAAKYWLDKILPNETLESNDTPDWSWSPSKIEAELAAAEARRAAIQALAAGPVIDGEATPAPADPDVFG